VRKHCHVGMDSSTHMLSCQHLLEECSDCGVNYTTFNALSVAYHVNPNLLPPTTDIAAIVQHHKNRGNDLYRAKNSQDAIACYSEAIMVSTSRQLWQFPQDYAEEVSVLLSNRAAAEMETGDYELACLDAEACTRLRPGWSKGWFRMGKALEALGREIAAEKAYETGYNAALRDNDDKGARELMQALLKLRKGD